MCWGNRSKVDPIRLRLASRNSTRIATKNYVHDLSIPSIQTPSTKSTTPRPHKKKDETPPNDLGFPCASLWLPPADQGRSVRPRPTRRQLFFQSGDSVDRSKATGDSLTRSRWSAGPRGETPVAGAAGTPGHGWDGMDGWGGWMDEIGCFCVFVWRERILDFSRKVPGFVKMCDFWD